MNAQQIADSPAVAADCGELEILKKLLAQPRNESAQKAFALDEIAQLQKSERGTAALKALAKLLWDQSTWSLDVYNQEALVSLLARSLDYPAVREMVQARKMGRLS